MSDNTVEQPAAQITVNDLVLAANIIDLATQRGAFKAAEASQVGGCFQTLVAFIKANTPQEEASQEAEAVTEE